MKVCTYHRQTDLGIFKRLGVFYNSSTIFDVNIVWRIYFEEQGHYEAETKANNSAPYLLSEFLQKVENPIFKLQQTWDIFEDQLKRGILKSIDGAVNAFDLKDDKKVKLGAPLDKINMYRDFYAHEKHVAVGFKKRNEPIPPAWYEIPAYYKGATAGFIGDGDEILWPSYTDELDYELELACVIGKSGKNISQDQAANHIFGYTILNDISARDIQRKEMAIRLGPAKGKDFCSIIGPIIVTADEFDYEEPNLTMTAVINDKEWSRGKSGDAHYSWAQMIEHASKEEWLMAGDLLGSGTVGTGCGLELDKKIQQGDKIVLEVESIGKLTNYVGYKNK